MTSRLAALARDLGRNGWTGPSFSAVRVVFGAYLFVHFAGLVPWAAELFSSAGMLPDASVSPLAAIPVPNPLREFDAPAVATAVVSLGAALSLAFAAGYRDRIAAFGLWLVLACLFDRNPLIANPSLPYVGWLLLAHLLVPRAPRGSLDAWLRPGRANAWHKPAELHAATWIVMAVGYSYSGLTKLVSPSWLDGSALARVLENPLARATPLRELALALPEPLLAVATWSTLALELGFALFALSARLRPLAWAAMLGAHGGLMLLLDFADLSFGMVILHLQTFDPAWLEPGRRRIDAIFAHCSTKFVHSTREIADGPSSPLHRPR